MLLLFFLIFFCCFVLLLLLCGVVFDDAAKIKVATGQYQHRGFVESNGPCENIYGIMLSPRHSKMGLQIHVLFKLIAVVLLNTLGVFGQPSVQSWNAVIHQGTHAVPLLTSCACFHLMSATNTTAIVFIAMVKRKAFVAHLYWVAIVQKIALRYAKIIDKRTATCRPLSQ